MAAEKKLENRVKKYLSTLPNTWFMKTHGGSIFQKAGIPDLIICRNGLFYGLELKAPGEEPTALQLAVGEKIIIARGGWLCSDAFEEIKEWLE